MILAVTLVQGLGRRRPRVPDPPFGRVREGVALAAADLVLAQTAVGLVELLVAGQNFEQGFGLFSVRNDEMAEVAENDFEFFDALGGESEPEIFLGNVHFVPNVGVLQRKQPLEQREKVEVHVFASVRDFALEPLRGLLEDLLEYVRPLRVDQQRNIDGLSA